VKKLKTIEERASAHAVVYRWEHGHAVYGIVKEAYKAGYRAAMRERKDTK